MIINASIKNVRIVILPQNCYPIALFFKDGGGLANHPLSCHPQGVFGRRESERKGEKMRAKEKRGKTGALCAKSFFIGQKSLPLQCVQRAYIATKTSKITKINKSS